MWIAKNVILYQNVLANSFQSTTKDLGSWKDQASAKSHAICY